MRWYLVTLLICLLCSTLTAGDTDDWPMFQHDPQHSGYSFSSMPESLREVWTNESSSMFGGLGLSFAISEDKLFEARIHSVSARNINTGVVLWSHGPSTTSLSFPAVKDNRIYLNRDSEIVCHDAGTGEVVWRHVVPFLNFLSFPIVVDGHVIVGGGDPGEGIWWTPEPTEALDRARRQAHRIMCLDAETGEVMWEFYTRSFAVYAPAYFSGRVYVNDNNKYVYCLDAQTGRSIWEKEIEWTNCSSLSLDGKRILIGTYDGIICLELEGGDMLWKFDCGDKVYRTPAVAYDRVYTSVKDVLYCLDAEKGELIWEKGFDSPITSSVIVADGKVAFGTANGTLYIVRAESGAICETLWLDDVPVVALALSDGKLFVGQENGRISCFEESAHKDLIVVVFILGLAVLSISMSIWYGRRSNHTAY